MGSFAAWCSTGIQDIQRCRSVQATQQEPGRLLGSSVLNRYNAQHKPGISLHGLRSLQQYTCGPLCHSLDTGRRLQRLQVLFCGGMSGIDTQPMQCRPVAGAQNFFPVLGILLA